MKKIAFLLLILQVSCFRAAEQKLQSPELPNEMLEKLALDIIMPEINKAKNLPELDKACKTSLFGFSKISKQHFAIVNDEKFINQVKAICEKKKSEILNKVQQMLNERFELYKFNIIKNGINAKNSNGNTPLIAAAQNGDNEVAKTLIENEASVNIRDKVGNTALILISAQKGKEETAKLLINNGANINAKNNQGETALIIAAFNGNGNMVKLLIKNKALLDFKDKNGRTALMIAAKNGFLEMIKLLIDSGADINIKNNKGHTVLDIAKEKGYEDIAKLLEQYKK